MSQHWRCKYEESVANINVVGKKSVVLELKPQIKKFFDVLEESYMIDFKSPMYDIICILTGECCEGDYIITSDEDDSHDFEAFATVVAWHGIDIDVVELKHIYNKLKPFLRKRTVTWG